MIEHRYDAAGGQVPELPLGRYTTAFIDPPYNIGVKYADDPTGDRVDPATYYAWVAGVLATVRQHMRPAGTVWFLCNAAHVDTIGPLLTKHIGPRQYLVIKQETFAQYQQKTLTEDYRVLFCHRVEGGAGKPVFNPDAIRIPSSRLLQKTPDKRADPRGRVPGQVWNIRRLQGTAADRVDWHKTQIAPELASRIILGWSNEGDEVLDVFAGSGIFGVIAKGLGRNYTGVDGSPTYVQKIKERLQL